MKIKKKKAPNFLRVQFQRIIFKIKFFVDDNRTLKILADL